MRSFKKVFDERLPDRRDFYSSVRGECISDKDYLHAVNVWNMLEMKVIGDYHNICLKTLHYCIIRRCIIS